MVYTAFFTSSFKKNIENEKNSKKSISFDFIESRILRYVLHCSIFFGARLENPKINKRVIPNNSGGGPIFFQKN